MKRNLVLAVAFVATAATFFVAGQFRKTEAAAASETMLVHNVYFSLKDSSPEAKKKLVDACKKYLATHPGTAFFAAGTLADDLKRPVNDQDFDVGLHLVFKNRAAHDKYQEAPLHKQFIEENRETWKKVRVFDSVAE